MLRKHRQRPPQSAKSILQQISHVVHYTREQGARLRPVCTFTKRYLDSHPGIVTLAPV